MCCLILKTCTLWTRRPHGAQKEAPVAPDQRAILIHPSGIHRWTSICVSDDQLIISFYPPPPHSHQLVKAETWSPWTPMACLTPMSSSSSPRTPKMRPSRRPKPSAPTSTPNGTRPLLCEFITCFLLRPATGCTSPLHMTFLVSIVTIPGSVMWPLLYIPIVAKYA